MEGMTTFKMLSNVNTIIIAEEGNSDPRLMQAVKSRQPTGINGKNFQY